MHAKTGVSEQLYFARQEFDRRRRAASERQALLITEERDRARSLHLMKCPKCGMQLEEIPLDEVRVDKCLSCEGLWLDKGELEVIRQEDDGFMGTIVSVFR